MIGIPDGYRTLLSSPEALRGGGILGAQCRWAPARRWRWGWFPVRVLRAWNNRGSNMRGGAGPDEMGGTCGKKGRAIWKGQGPAEKKGR